MEDKPIRYDKRIIFRAMKELAAQAKKYAEMYPERYENLSEYYRAAVAQKNREHQEELQATKQGTNQPPRTHSLRAVTNKRSHHPRRSE